MYFVPGAEVSDVGVAGLRLGGGISFFAVRYGFVCDNIKNFEIVLGNDTVISANATHNPDLFKALKADLGISALSPALTLPLSPVMICGVVG